MRREGAGFEFKPALLRGAVRYGVEAGQLTSSDGWEVALDAVTGAAFVNHAMKGTRLIRLDLWLGETRRSLSYSGNVNSWTSDPDAMGFLKLVQTVLDELARTGPGLEVTLGEYGKSRRVMFAIGLVAALAGAGIFAAAFVSGLPNDRLAGAAIPMALLTALGLALSYGYAPWRKPPRATPAALSGVIGGIVDAHTRPSAGG